MEINFKNKKYELLFSNDLTLFWALNFADELFFSEFNKLCGKKYRIFSVIKKGWQNKYGLISDLKALRSHFTKKIEDNLWPKRMLQIYNFESVKFKKELERISRIDHDKCKKNDIFKNLRILKEKSAVLDAMSNMFYLFSVLNGPNFQEHLSSYNLKNKGQLNKNLIFFTQPVKESKFAKIKIKKFTQKFKLNNFDNNFSLILRIGAYMKDDVSDLLVKKRKIIGKMFFAISKKLGIKQVELEYLQLGEIINFNTSSSKKLIESRKDLTIIFYEKEKMQIIEGVKAKIFLKKNNFFEIKEIKNKELRGMVANPGKAVGRAVLAFNSREANSRIKQGDILVAPYTAVEYFPAIKMAAAVITETGGITSHAAIVSRELRIPCIIGVKDVMKIIKTGDKICLDANKGEIRIIN